MLLLVGLGLLWPLRYTINAEEGFVSNHAPLILQDEGSVLGAITKFNCVGAGVVCTRSGTTGTATIGGGGGGLTLTEIEIDFGSTAKFSITATVVDANVDAASKIIFLQSGIAATGKQADENNMDYIVCNATPGSGSFLLQCDSRSPLHGAIKINYTIG